MKDEIVVHLLQNNNNNNYYNNNINKKIYENDESSPTFVTTSSNITPTLLFSAFIAVLGSFSFGFVTGYPSPVQAEIVKDLDLSIAEYSLFGSMHCVGGAIGALMCGKLADYFGRKHAFIITGVLYFFGWFAISVGQSAWMLDLARCMLGVAMAFSGYAIQIYIAECTPKNYRGGFVILHTLTVTIGGSTVFLIGLIVSWRTLALIGMVPSLLQIVGSFFIPESPRWLLMMGRNKKFEEALQRFRGGSAGISQEAADIRDCVAALHQLDKVGILELFQRKYAYSLTIGIGLSALIMLVGLGGIITYASSVFESAGLSVMVGTIALSIFQLLSAGFGILLMDKTGRRPLLMISAAGLCLGCLMAGVSFLLEEHHLLGSFSPYITLIGILIYVGSYPMLGGASGIIISEIYPLNIKGLAGSIATLASWLSSWIIIYIFNFAMEWSSSGTFFILASICAFTLIFVTKLVPETKGKTLEEVHISISDVWLQ